MRFNFHFLLLAATATLAVRAGAMDPSFAGVESEIRQRTGRSVAWQRDEVDRRRAQAEVRAALRRPLTLPAAVQIALSNNSGLQATFEEIGLSFADLRQARTVSNPEVDFAAKFPDRAPSGTQARVERRAEFRRSGHAADARARRSTSARRHPTARGGRSGQARRGGEGGLLHTCWRTRRCWGGCVKWRTRNKSRWTTPGSFMPPATFRNFGSRRSRPARGPGAP